MKYYQYSLLLAPIFIIDQLTKCCALTYWQQGVELTPFLRFELSMNTGISWGFFHNTVSYSWLFFTITSLIMLLTAALILYSYKRLQEGYTIYGEGLVIVGSLSNILDRFYHGGVIDFIVLHAGNCVWPTFNCADVSVVLGVLIIFVQQCLRN